MTTSFNEQWFFEMLVPWAHRRKITIGTQEENKKALKMMIAQDKSLLSLLPEALLDKLEVRYDYECDPKIKDFCDKMGCKFVRRIHEDMLEVQATATNT